MLSLAVCSNKVTVGNLKQLLLFVWLRSNFGGVGANSAMLFEIVVDFLFVLVHTVEGSSQVQADGLKASLCVC